MQKIFSRISFTALYQILQVIAALLCGYFVLFPITDGDIFWHLAAGREIVARKGFLFADPFSYTLDSPRWIDVHWLFQVLVYAVERFGGLRLLPVLKAACVAGAVQVIFSAFPKNGRTMVLWFVTAALFFFQRYLIPMRPILLSLLFIAADISFLERFCESGKRRYLAGAAAVQIVWTNCQGLFLLGPAIALAYGAGETADRITGRTAGPPTANPVMSPVRMPRLLQFFPLVLTMCSFVNPYGWRAVAFAAGLLVRIRPAAANIYSTSIDENMPLLRMIGTTYGHYVAVVGAAAVLYLLSILHLPRAVRLRHSFLASGGLLLAWMAQRNGILFTFLVLPGLLWNSGSSTGGRFHRYFRFVTPVFSAVAISIALILTVRTTRMLMVWPHALAPFSHPVGSAEYLLLHATTSGNLFNADRYGGYLVWKLFPGYKVSSDTRLTLRPESFFREYLSLVNRPESFGAYADRWNITMVALPVAPLYRYCDLAAALYRSDRWNLIYTDGVEVLFSSDKRFGGGIRMDSRPETDLILKRLKHRFSSSEPVYAEARYWLARWCCTVGALEQARYILDACPEEKAPRLLLAGIDEKMGLISEAESLLCAMSGEYPADSDIRLALALFYLRTGRKDEGLRHLESVLKKDPFNKRARNVLYNLTGKKKEK